MVAKEGSGLTNSPVLRESVPEDQKFYLESMLFRDPNSPALRDAYFTTLLAMSRSSFGLSYASLPDCPSPLFSLHDQ